MQGNRFAGKMRFPTARLPKTGPEMSRPCRHSIVHPRNAGIFLFSDEAYTSPIASLHILGGRDGNAADGGVVVLTEDVTLTNEVMTIAEDTVINLDGNKITA